MESINKSILGALAVGGKATVGSSLAVRGSASVGHNLRVDGWLEARNIKGAYKGLFGASDRLVANYPRPANGWHAGVLATAAELESLGVSAEAGYSYYRAYVAWDGVWEAQGGVVKIEAPDNDYDSLDDRLTDAETGVTAATSAIEDLQETVGQHGQTIAQHTQTLGTLGDTVTAQGKTIASQGETIAGHTQTLGTLGDTVATMGQTVADHEEIIADQGQTIAALEQTTASQGQTLTSLGQTVANQGATLTECGQAIAEQSSDIAGLQKDVASHTQTLGEMGSTVTTLGQTVGEHTTAIATHGQSLDLLFEGLEYTQTDVLNLTEAMPTVRDGMRSNAAAIEANIGAIAIGDLDFGVGGDDNDEAAQALKTRLLSIAFTFDGRKEQPLLWRVTYSRDDMDKTVGSLTMYTDHLSHCIYQVLSTTMAYENSVWESHGHAVKTYVRKFAISATDGVASNTWGEWALAWGQDADTRLNTLEGIDAGTRLNTLEGIDAGTRLAALEAVKADTRLTSVENVNLMQDRNLSALGEEVRALQYAKSLVIQGIAGVMTSLWLQGASDGLYWCTNSKALYQVTSHAATALETQPRNGAVLTVAGNGRMVVVSQAEDDGLIEIGTAGLSSRLDAIERRLSALEGM